MRQQTTRAVIGLAVAVGMFAGVAVGPPATATTYTSIVSDNPSNFTPNVEDGAVRTIARVGDVMVAGGNFTTVTPPGGGTAISRTNLFAFDAATGVISQTFVPQVNGIVNRVVSSGDGQTVYVAGKFTQLDGQNVTKVLRLDATTGERVPGFSPPALNGQVWDMVLANGSLYLAGAFTKVGKVAKSGLAALDPGTGQDTQQISATFAEPFRGGTVAGKALDVSADGRYLMVIGNFTMVNGQSREQIAMFNTNTSPATLATWSTIKYSTPCSGAFNSYVRDVSIAPDGSFFSVVATGAWAGGVDKGTLCDAATRWEFRPDSANENPTWVDYTGGDTLLSVSVTGQATYLGGHQRWLNNPYAADRSGPGAVARSGIAVVDSRNGLPYSWNPGRPRGVGLRDFLPLADGLWVGHDTKRLGGEARARIGFLPLAGGKAIPPDNTGTLPGETFSIGSATTGDDTVTRRLMTTSAVVASSVVADGGQDWSSSRGAFMVDGTLFTGWSDGTLRQRSYDGTTFGPSTTLNLNGASASAHRFVAELPNVTGMFFDRTTARLYYTKSGQSQLFYRYFLPESGIVGAVGFTGPGNTAGIDWSKAGGMFLANGSLYVADRTTGELRSVGWNGSTPTGSATVISGPAADGQDWRARSLFLYAD